MNAWTGPNTIGLLSGVLLIVALGLLAWTMSFMLRAGRPSDALQIPVRPSSFPPRHGALRVAFLAAVCLIAGVSTWLASGSEAPPVRLTMVAMVGVLAVAICNWGLNTILARRQEQFDEAMRLSRISNAARGEFRTCWDRTALCDRATRRLSEVLQVAPVTAYLAGEGVHRPVACSGGEIQKELVFSSASLLVRQMEAARGATMLPMQWGMEEEAGTGNRALSMAPRSQVEAESLRTASLSGRWLVPWWREQFLTGFWVLGHRKVNTDYSEHEIWFLHRMSQELAESVAAIASLEAHAAELANNSRRQLERDLAASIKNELFLGDAITTPGVECAGARHVSANGETECYMLAPAGHDATGILLARSSGTGSEGPLRLARLQGWCAGWEKSTFEAFRQEVERLRATLHPGGILDAFYARVDGARQVIHYVNAGFPSPFVVRRSREGGAVLRLNAGESLSPFKITEGEFAMVTGDVMVAASQGLAAVRNDGGEEWGEGSLIETIMSWQGQRAGDIAELTMRTARSFAGEREPERDLSLVVVKARSVEPGVDGC